MLFVLVLEIGGNELVGRPYPTFAEAQTRYDEAARVCLDGPDEDGSGTPYLISNCWLYSADIQDEDAALHAALAGQADLISAFSVTD
jgi:hypothetical protein